MEEGRDGSRYKQTLADDHRRFGHRPFLSRSVSSSGDRDCRALWRARHFVLSLLVSERPPDYGDSLLRALHEHYNDLNLLYRRTTVDGRLHPGCSDLSAIWLPLLFYLHQRKTEDLLRLAHDELETRVQARTHELATVNQSLTQEIAERMEIEASLRTSEALSQASQHELRESRTELRALAGQLLTAQEEDRRRISRDLHDDINQRLAMLSMDLRRMEKGPSSNLEPLQG